MAEGSVELDGLLRAGDLERAKGLALSRLDKSPKDQSALVALAKIALVAGDTRDAESKLKLAAALGNTPQVRLVLAGLKNQQSRPNEALAEYKSLAAEQPQLAEAQFGAGLALLNGDDFKAAESYLAKAVALQPDQAVFRFHLARAQVGLERIHDAMKSLQKSLELNPFFSPIYPFYGVVLLEIGHIDLALESMQLGLEPFPDDELILDTLLQIAERTPALSQPAVFAQKLAAMLKDNPAAYVALTKRLLETVGANPARRGMALALGEVVPSGPKWTFDVYMALGAEFERLQPASYVHAAAQFERAAKVSPEAWEPLNNAALMYLSTKDGTLLPKAVAYFEKAKSLAPNEYSIQYNLVLALVQTKSRVGDASALVNELAKRIPTSHPLYMKAQKLSHAVAHEVSHPRP